MSLKKSNSFMLPMQLNFSLQIFLVKKKRCEKNPVVRHDALYRLFSDYRKGRYQYY